MKKIIYVFTALISLFLFNTNFQAVCENEFTIANSPLDIVKKQTGYECIGVPFNFSNNRTQVFDELYSFIESNEPIVMTSRLIERTDSRKQMDYYLYEPENENIFSKVEFVDNRKVNFHLQSDDYISTVEDENASAVFDFLSRDYNDRYEDITTIRQLSEVETKISDDDTSTYFYFFSPDVASLKQKISSSALDKFINKDMGFNDYHSVESVSVDSDFAMKMLIVATITFIMLFLCEMNRDKKEIIVLKQLGYTNNKIIFYLYKKTFLIIGGLFLIITVINYIIFVRHVRSVAYSFLLLLCKYHLAFLCIILMLMLCAFLVVYHIKEIAYMKKDKQENNFIIANMLLKIIVLCMIMQPFVYYISLGLEQINKYEKLKKYPEKYLGYAYLFSLDIRGNNVEQRLEKIVNFFDSRGALYQEFDANEIRKSCQLDQNDSKYCPPLLEKPLIIVNGNFLKDYEIKTPEGQLVSIDQLRNNTLLVPVKYESEKLDLSEYCDGACNTIVYIENGIRIYSHEPSSKTESLVIDDAILKIKSNLGKESNWYYPYLFLSLQNFDNSIENLYEEMHEDGLTGFTLATSDERYQLELIRAKEFAANAIIVMIIYSLMVFAFFYEQLYLIYTAYKKDFAIKTLLGVSYINKYYELFICMFLPYVVSGVIIYQFFQIELLNVISYFLITVIFEMILALVLIYRFEHTRLINTLKGDKS